VNYLVEAGVNSLVFTIDKSGELVVKSYITSGQNIFDESEIIDDPTRHRNATNFEIDDPRFAIVNDFAKHGFTVFQRYKDNDETIENGRCVLAVKFTDVEYR